MSAEHVVHLPAPVQPPAPEVPAPPAPTSQQVQAVDQVFSQAKESELVRGLLGVAASAVLLKDLATEALSSDEEEAQKKKKAKDDPEPEPTAPA